MTPLLPPEVLFADEYNRPVFQMGPHDAAALARNYDLVRRSPPSGPVDWSIWFGPGAAFTLTVNGREAIDLAIDDIGPGPDDEILILTASGGPYISRCVTESIERRCRWSRTRSAATRAIFVIHEFGFPAQLPEALAASGLPVIEDCAYGFGTSTLAGPTGRLGDYVLFSFSKAFPLPYGGLLKSPRILRRPSVLSPQAQRELPILAQHYLEDREAAFAARRAVFEMYRARFAAEGLQPLFDLEPGVTPHSFIVAIPDQAKAEAMKPKLQAAGVISSVYYGGGGYFLPNHQGLSAAAVDYIVTHVLKALREA